MLSKLAHVENAHAPIVTTDSGIVTVERARQPTNALSSMAVAEAVIVTCPLGSTSAHVVPVPLPVAPGPQQSVAAQVAVTHSLYFPSGIDAVQGEPRSPVPT
jgi:hypothetical protein